MQTSESLTELAPALSKAQALILGADKDSRNPHFNAEFSSLASVWEACRKPLTDNGLSIIQALGNDGDMVKCTTMLLHSSGQFIRAEFSMLPQQKGPQPAGSIATYLRRYCLQSMVGVAPLDDDGNAAQHPMQRTANEKYNNPPAKANPMAAVNTRPVAEKTPVSVPNNPASNEGKFDPQNEIHKTKAMEFLDKKKQARLIKPFLLMMTGQPANIASLNAAWDRLNPEAPDAEPTGY